MVEEPGGGAVAKKSFDADSSKDALAAAAVNALAGARAREPGHSWSNYGQLDAGAFEIMWRVLPPRLVYLRPMLARFILLGGEWENGWQEFADEAHALLARGEVVLVPILDDNAWARMVICRDIVVSICTLS